MNAKIKAILVLILLIPLVYAVSSGTFSYFSDVETSTGNTFTAGTWRDGTINVDVYPGSCPNPINVKAGGVLPVAILGTKDWPVDDLDPTSVRVWREDNDGKLIGGNVEPLRYSYEDTATPFDPKTEEGCCHDLAGDGIVDLNVKFGTPALVDDLRLDEIADDTTIYLNVTINITDDRGNRDTLIGEDCVLILNKPKKSAIGPTLDNETSDTSGEPEDEMDGNEEQKY